MHTTRTFLAATALFALAGSVQAQAPGEPTPAGPAESSVEFKGRIESINTSSRTITIEAPGIPGAPGGLTAFPYNVPDSVDISRYHEGDEVAGLLVVRDKRAIVENLVVTGSKQDGEKKPDTPDPSAGAVKTDSTPAPGSGAVKKDSVPR